MNDISASLPTTGRGLDPEGSLLSQLTGIDWTILVSTLALAAIGLATVHSASAELPVDYLPRQAVWIGLGLVLMVVAFFIDYNALLDMGLPLYGIGLVLLIAVLFVGSERGGAQSWLGTATFGFQPSELAKLATVLFLSRYLADVNRPVLTMREITVSGMIVGVPVVLVALQPDMGTAAMFMPMLAGMLLVGGIRMKVWVTGIVAVLILLVGVWFFAMQDYQRQRVRTFLEPGSDPQGAGYQVRQSKIAVGSGQLYGKGYMQGTQSQLRFLPARHTDFIFAVLAEEWGFLGVLVTLALFGILLVNGARIAMRARDREGILLSVGLMSILSFHILYNTAMVVGLVPITGIPLPFLSYGGTFTIFTFTAVGLLLGVHVRRYVNR